MDTNKIKKLDVYQELETKSLNNSPNGEVNDDLVEIKGIGLVKEIPDSEEDIFAKDLEVVWGIQENNGEARPIDLLFNHKNDDIYASTRNDTLTFKDEGEFITFKALVGKDEKLTKRVKSGLANGASMGFYVLDAEPRKDKNYGRVIKKIMVAEQSITWEPAHLMTTVKGFSNEYEDKSSSIKIEKKFKKEDVKEDVKTEVPKTFEETLTEKQLDLLKSFEGTSAYKMVRKTLEKETKEKK